MTGKSLTRLIAAGFALTLFASAAAIPDEPAEVASSLPTVAEARGRARLLHGTIHDTLQLVHARYYRQDEGLMIPAASLEHVFRSIADRDGVRLGWLAVDG